MKINTPFLITATFASLALAGCGKGGSPSGASGDLAIVNGEAITKDEYYRYLERKPAVQVVAPQNGTLQAGQVAEMPTAAPLGFQAMRDLINRRILLDVARDEKVMPTEAEVAKELDFQTKRRPDFVKGLTDQGLTLEDIRRDLTLDVAKERIVTKGITVTAKEADDFIKANPDQFMTPEQVKLGVIQVTSAATQKQVDAALASGKSFSQVATEFSVAPDVRKNQGVIVVNDLRKADPALQQLIGGTAEGKTTAWTPDNGQFVKIQVMQKIPSKKQVLDATQKEVVRRAMAMERGNGATDLPKRLVEKLKTSKIVVNPPNLKTLWDKAFNTLKEQDVQANTRTATPPAGAPPTTAPAPTTP